MNIVIATIHSWNVEFAKEFKKKNSNLHTIKIIQAREELSVDSLEKFSPDYIFFPHWSYIIPKEIYEKYNCVVFHMTDLPYGRGGSPLQNLIVRGIFQTKISAIKVTEGLDEGPIYLKKDLSLEGSASEIYRRASNIIFNQMIPYFLSNNAVAEEQKGEPVVFARRKPEESEIMADFETSKIFDYIRMLDAEGYPKAFIKYGDYRLEFDSAQRVDDKISAHVVIRKEGNDE